MTKMLRSVAMSQWSRCMSNLLETERGVQRKGVQKGSYEKGSVLHIDTCLAVANGGACRASCELKRRRKGDPKEVYCAAVTGADEDAEMDAPVSSIAEQLQMRAWTDVSILLSRHRPKRNDEKPVVSMFRTDPFLTSFRCLLLTKTGQAVFIRWLRLAGGRSRSRVVPARLCPAGRRRR
jgi:hypothetical protein